jgi:5-methylcytosine-specific restriction enzyme B
MKVKFNEKSKLKILNTFKDKIGKEFSTSEIKNLLKDNNIYPSDYCYNSYNKGEKEIYLFEKVKNGIFKYLGENYNYTGDIYWKPQGKNEEKIVGRYENGERILFKEEINKLIEGNQGKNNMKTKNIMLYGAPGVGKTHNYKRLITMIENGTDEKTIFDTVSKNETTNDFDNSIYENIKKEKRIEFVTFHQSYSYEDFIEGFRPQDNGNIKLEDGIFKNIVNKTLGKIKINEIFSINREITSERSSYIIESITNDLINIKKDRDNKIVPIPKNLLIELLENIDNGLISLDDIKNRNLDNLETKFDKYMYGYNSILHTLCKNVIEDIEYKEQKNFYIVIDEINRGNISKIFGELITLIEEDKRDTYEVTLPYSKEKFKIPSNLYIIATMNSTDKSIATIDIALRRRFTFLKMKPKEELVKNENANKLMNELNKHILNSINEDYQLGHSYFMNIVDDKDLEFVKEYKIKPLLEEYFYGDKDNYNIAENILYGRTNK